MVIVETPDDLIKVDIFSIDLSIEAIVFDFN